MFCVDAAKRLIESELAPAELEAVLGHLGVTKEDPRRAFMVSLLLHRLSTEPLQVICAVAQVREPVVKGRVEAAVEVKERSILVSTDPLTEIVGGVFLVKPTNLIIVPNVAVPGPVWNGASVTVTQVDCRHLLTPAECALLAQPGYELQVCCFCLNDTHPGRIQWPLHANLTVNSIPIAHVPLRSAVTPIGPNARDAPVVLSLASVAGAPPNAPGIPHLMRAIAAVPANGLLLRLCLAGYDARPFALSMHMARKLSDDEARALVPAPPPFAEALGRARHCARASDDDEVVVEGGLEVSLRCPISAAQMTVPVRYEDCPGMAAFDLDSLLHTSRTSGTWKCPMCNAGGPPGKLRRDPFLGGVLAALAASPFPGDAQVRAIRVGPGGEWQAQAGGALGRVVPPEETEAALAGTFSGLAFLCA
jgi:hypothetical protein